MSGLVERLGRSARRIGLIGVLATAMTSAAFAADDDGGGGCFDVVNKSTFTDQDLGAGTCTTCYCDCGGAFSYCVSGSTYVDCKTGAPTLLTCGTKTASPLAGGGCQCNTGICGGSVTITVRNQQGGGRC